MNLSTLYKHLLPLAACAVLAACGGGSPGSGVEPPDGELQYNRSAGLLPSPNDLAFAGSSDGTLTQTSSDAVNATDGFSTTSTATATASVPIDPDSVQGGSTVRVFAVNTVDSMGNPAQPNDASNPGPKAVGGLNTSVDNDSDGELAPGTEYKATVSAADRNNRTVAVTPLTRLQPDTTYMVVLTNGIQDRDGDPLDASADYAQAKSNDPLVQSQLTVAGGAGVNTANVIASWTFTTQTVGRSLDMVRTEIQGKNPVFVDTNGNPNQLTPIPDSSLPVSIPNGDILAGVLSGLPYYLKPGSSNPKNVRTSAWKTSGGENLSPTNRKPVSQASLNVPVLVALPSSDGGTANDVVIFQHGITSNRTAMLGIANTLTGQGFAVVAIDLPLHGITDTSSGLYAGSNERHFNVDLVDNDGTSGPDGKIDPSGEHFINLASLLTSRDNLRQAAADLFTVTKAILDAESGNVSLDSSTGDTDADFTTNLTFVGHSLGGIVGGPFLATEPNVDTSVFGMSGGHIAKLLDGSPQIGPEIERGVEAEGLTKGTPAYEQFLGAAQTVIDKGDPINYTTRTAQGGTAQPSGNSIPDRNVLELEVVGGNSSAPDQVVPNNLVKPYQQGVPDGTIPSPTAGTDPLVKLLQATQINSDPMSAGDYIIRYTAGKHASLLDPNAGSSAATSEMQTNVATFLKSDGTNVTFTGSGTVASP